MVGYLHCSKYRAGSRAFGETAPRPAGGLPGQQTYFEVPEGLVERFVVSEPDPFMPLGLRPGVPLAPEELDPPVAEEPPLEAPSCPQAESSAPDRANEITAANAVTFMFTSVVGKQPVGEQRMDRPASPEWTTVVLYTDVDGRARFREERIALSAGTEAARLSPLQKARAFQLRRSPVGFHSEFHCTGEPQWVFVLGGEMEIGLQDGTTRCFRAGESFFSADVLPEGARFDPAVHGHRSAQRGADPLVTLFVKV